MSSRKTGWQRAPFVEMAWCSQPGNFLCRCERRGTHPSEPGDKGGGAWAGSQVAEVLSQLPCFPHVSDQVTPFTPLALPFPDDVQVSLWLWHPFSFPERSPRARSPSSFLGPRWAVLDSKCGERNADMARGPAVAQMNQGPLSPMGWAPPLCQASGKRWGIQM